MENKVNILLETPDFIIINKPAGLVVHPDGKSDKETLVYWIIEKYPEIENVGEPMLVDGKEIKRPGIVHRLDTETSGALVIAKNQEAFEHLKKQFQEHLVEKEYNAFVWGHFKENEGVIDEPIGRNINDFRRWHAGRGIRGETREAVTKWQVVKQFEDENGEKFSFMKLSPQTGRTHQLRVHMKYIQRPIVSDSLYNESKPNSLGFDRVALHARKIRFKALDNSEIEAIAPYPEDFEGAIARYHVL
jgi:23S rRNA pseudouridine1911/1915/1917 synthase